MWLVPCNGQQQWCVSRRLDCCNSERHWARHRRHLVTLHNQLRAFVALAAQRSTCLMARDQRVRGGLLCWAYVTDFYPYHVMQECRVGMPLLWVGP